jgi:hypothetical protein
MAGLGHRDSQHLHLSVPHKLEKWWALGTAKAWRKGFLYTLFLTPQPSGDTYAISVEDV